MAKRRRLSPANPAYLEGKPPLTHLAEEPGIAPTVDQPAEKSPKRAPIADVVSDASAQSALQELSGVLAKARDKGLMIEELPLEAIDTRHLVRDRLTADEDELQALMSSLRSRGQQTPIEVVRLSVTIPSQNIGHKYGLISGWRRMIALKTLAETEPELGLTTVLARIIQPETAQEAYVAMVEENEIRVNLSHYERARITVKALEEGVYENQKQALQGLFGNVPRAKRSKIGSFMRIVQALDDMLYFPAHISEKLGLALVREMNRNSDFTEALRADLMFADRPMPDAEMDLLAKAVLRVQDQQEQYAQSAPEESVSAAPTEICPTPTGDMAHDLAYEPALDTLDMPSEPTSVPVETHTDPQARITQKIHEGLSLHFIPEKHRIELVGEAVTDDLQAALQIWLAQNTRL